MTDIGRFLQYIKKDENNCWIWQGSISPNGSGNFNESKPDGKYKRVLAHRFSYKHYKGQIPKGMNVRQSCNKKACVNPDHLFISTVKETAIDGWKGDKRNAQRDEYKQEGELNRNVFLSEKDIVEIRNTPEIITNIDLGKKYGVSNSHISRIRRGIYWSHILKIDTRANNDSER